ncbi:MAG: hypothetical protein K8R23_09630 [Chthoniobacter sp.]|nr:hypothetical protein [Chthoniobacter sp.]
MLHRLLHPFGKLPPEPAPKSKALPGELAMGLTLEPAALRLSETHEVKVTVTLANQGRKLVQLSFPTTQRIEVVLKNKSGKKLVQWSEDHVFTPDPTLVAINRGERLEYSATVSTRDMVAGESYTVEAFFPNFEQFRQEAILVPEK